MAANLDYLDIETRVANALRIPTTQTTEMTKLQAVINEVYRDLCAKQDWWWTWKRTTINTTAKTTDGTVAVTLGSTTVTFSQTPVVGDITGFALSIPANANDPLAVYRIAQYAVPPAATLDAAYTGATDAAATYRLYADQYVLPTDVAKLLRVMVFGDTVPLERLGIEELERRRQQVQREGKPIAYSIYDFQTTGDPTQARLLQIWPWPDKAYRMEIWYRRTLNTELSAEIQPLIPDDYRQVLVYGALARGYPIFLNDLERGAFYQGLFNDVLTLMAAQQREYAADQSGVQPEMRSYRPRTRRPRTMVSLGEYFDRWPVRP